LLDKPGVDCIQENIFFEQLFVFKRNNEIISLKTKIYLSDNSTKTQVLGIGDEFIPTQSSICIELFQENKNGLLLNLAKSECLDTFFKHAFRLITKKSAMVRPLFVIKNSKSLDKILCGYQNYYCRLQLMPVLESVFSKIFYGSLNRLRRTSHWSRRLEDKGFA
jgi:hypothetical protein